MKQFLLLFACLLASGVTAAYNEGEDCPAGCVCPEEGVGPYVARCSTLNSEQKFGSKISRVIIENSKNLILDKKTFQAVGLENISTLVIVNCTFKKIDTRAFASLSLLRTLEFVSNKQLVLDVDAFNTTTSLIQLVLRENNVKFSRKSNNLFDVPLLRHLEMANEGITELHAEAFSKMPKLQSLNLSFNKIKSLGTEFTNLAELEDVDLSHNLLGEIGAEVFANNKNIDTLRLRGNPLTSMSGVHLAALTELDVSSCKFSKIDKATFSGFSTIKKLNLSNNALSEIAEDTFSLTNMSALSDLDLSHNALKGPLPEGLFQNLSNLGVLYLAHNPSLQIIPVKIFQELHDLFKLDLSFCGLKMLEDTIFQDLSSLSFLNLAGNSLDRLKPGVLNNLIVNLDLSHNKIQNLDDVKFSPDSRLRKLKLTGNKLSDLSTSSLSDLHQLESLDLSSCSLTSLWNTEKENPTVLDSIDTLSIAKNYISFITEEQLELTPNLLGIDILGNEFECGEAFNKTLKWFRDHNVKPTTQKLAEQKMENLELAITYSESEDVSITGWGDVREQLCGFRDREPLETVIDDDQNNLDDAYEGGDDDEDDENDEEEYEDEGEENYTDEGDSTNIPNNDIDSIVWRQSTVLAESNDNYLWSVIIVMFSVVAILCSLTILGACVLRWSRQRNSYGARMINTHLHPPKMKRDRSSIYQQLYEDPNHPTTPIMSMKNQGQTQYNFPEAQGSKQYSYITYLSKDFHDSTVIPQSV